MTEQQQRQLAEQVREACARAALDAFHQAAISGLCFEGAVECAVGAIRGLDLEDLLVPDRRNDSQPAAPP